LTRPIEQSGLPRPPRVTPGEGEEDDRVHARVPPGFAAVLINPAHTYPDLALPITAAEERILVAIDGKRTVGAILPRDDDAGGRLFERLWQYDQIVCDASEA
jgi:hypothetical protein